MKKENLIILVTSILLLASGVSAVYMADYSGQVDIVNATRASVLGILIGLGVVGIIMLCWDEIVN